MTRIEEAVVMYEQKFGRPAPVPWGVSDERRAEVLEEAIKAEKPVRADFDWWADMPPDSAA